MEKDNKYYDIIVDIVKKHRKFSGLEAILDDIVDDVYNHSEVIINSVPNESVIKAYIEKVVSTSIITVPKRIGFHSEIRHAIVSTTPQHFVTKNEVVEKVDNALVDKMINSADSTSSESRNSAGEDNISNYFVSSEDERGDILSSFDNELEQDNKEVPLKEEKVDNDFFALQDDVEEDTNLSLLEDVNKISQFEEAEEKEALSVELLPLESISEDVAEVPEKNDDILQDYAHDEADEKNTLDNNDLGNTSNENNLLAESTGTEEQNIEPEETYYVQEESITDVQNDVILEKEDDTERLTAVEDEASVFEPLPVVENLIQDEDVPALEEDSTELELDNHQDEVGDLELQDIEEPAEQALDIDNPVGVDILSEVELSTDDLLQAENSVDLEMEKTDELVQVEGFDDLELKSDNGELDLTDELSLDLNNDFLETSGSELNELEHSDEGNNSLELQVDSEDGEKFVTTDFTKFDFNPAAVAPSEDIDTDLIVKDIQDLANKKTELKVIDIYNMKYKENKSIAEISTELGIDENSVIDTLNEIIAVI